MGTGNFQHALFFLMKKPFRSEVMGFFAKEEVALPRFP